MSKYTPGPWQAEKTDKGSFWIQKGIAYSITLIGHKNAENDAHLIAASPEMYEALKQMLSYREGILECKEFDKEFVSLARAFDMIKAALAKAEGRVG